MFGIGRVEKEFVFIINEKGTSMPFDGISDFMAQKEGRSVTIGNTRYVGSKETVREKIRETIWLADRFDINFVYPDEWSTSCDFSNNSSGFMGNLTLDGFQNMTLLMELHNYLKQHYSSDGESTPVVIRRNGFIIIKVTARIKPQ
jgi:hypothetical protein